MCVIVCFLGTKHTESQPNIQNKQQTHTHTHTHKHTRIAKNTQTKLQAYKTIFQFEN